MRRIHKNLSPGAVPISLRYPSEENFESGKVPSPPLTTHEKREMVVASGAYDESHNDRYKQADTKKALNDIYHSKCAYCEFTVEQWHVEHYRPKHLYPWLAFSWDNLLFCCPACNEHKAVHFETINACVTIDKTYRIPADINLLGASYDMAEEPMMVNPEVTDPSNCLEFEKDGKIKSSDPRFAYTISTCKIDRQWLNDGRKKILDDLRKELNICAGYSAAKRNEILGFILKRSMQEAFDPRSTFTAFRRYVLRHWFKEEAKSILIYT